MSKKSQIQNWSEQIFFASDAGSPVCTACPTFSTTLDVEGASSIGACTCLQGYYQTSDASLNQICSACPEGSTTSGAGAKGVDECICDPFKYKALDSGACVDCMGGVDCSEPGGVVANLKIRPGYWRPSNASLDVRRCPDATIECDTSASGCPSGCLRCLGKGNASPHTSYALLTTI